MDQQRIAQFQADAILLWRRGRVWAATVPTKAWVVLGFSLLAAVIMAASTALAHKNAILRLKVQHGLRSGQLSIWIDDSLAYSGKLAGSARKKFGLLPESVQGSLSETLSVSSGTHQVRVRVTSDDGSVQEDTTRAVFERNRERTLSVTARRDDLSLSWPGASATAAESTSASGGWFNRYAGSLLVTIAGSIISALTGYAIKEIPRQIGSRPGETPKVSP